MKRRVLLAALLIAASGSACPASGGGPLRAELPPFLSAGVPVSPQITGGDDGRIVSGRALIYGGGYDHREIPLSGENGFAFTWDGTFPDGQGSCPAPAGGYFLSLELTDRDGSTATADSRIYVPEAGPDGETPEYIRFDIRGKLERIDGMSVTVDGTEYSAATFSRIARDLRPGSRVTGSGRAYPGTGKVYVENLEREPGTRFTFTGTADDIGDDYAVIGGTLMFTDAETVRYCPLIGRGDEVYGVYVMENGRRMITEYGPAECGAEADLRTGYGFAEIVR